MRTATRLALAAVLAALAATGCFYDVDDGEYVPPEDTSGDADTDSDGDTDSDTSQTGLGEPCEDDADCAEYEASTCTVNDYTSEYYCTFVDCTPADCEGGYECCDCSGVAGFDAVLCLNAEEAEMASTMAGCTCE